MFSDIRVTGPLCLTEEQLFFKKGTPKGTPTFPNKRYPTITSIYWAYFFGQSISISIHFWVQ